MRRAIGDRRHLSEEIDMTMRPTISCAIALLLTLGGALTACDVEDEEDRWDRIEHEHGSIEGSDALEGPDALEDPSSAPVASLTCEEQLVQDENFCDVSYAENTDFACCMAHASCIQNFTFDYCDCMYALGSPPHVACYEDAVSAFRDDKSSCKSLFPY